MTGEPQDLLEEIEISPISRWRNYGVWPSRLLAQLVVIFTAVQHVFWIEGVMVQYSEMFERNVVFMILSQAFYAHEESSRVGGYKYDKEDSRPNEFVVFNTTETRIQLEKIIDNYFTLEEYSVDSVSIAKEGGRIPFPQIHYVSSSGQAEDLWLDLRSVDDLGPFSPEKSPTSVTKFIHGLEKIEIFLFLEALNPTQWYLKRDACVLWKYEFTYTRRLGAGPFFAKINQHNPRRCTNKTTMGYSTPIFWLNAWLCFVCVWHFCYALSRVWRGVLVLNVLRQAHSTGDSDDGENTDSDSSVNVWDKISWADKLTIINRWVLISIVADVLLFSYGLFQIVQVSITTERQQQHEWEAGWVSDIVTALLGLGCVLQLVSLMEYAEYSLVDYLILQVNRVARQDVLKILCGIVPISAAYIVFGVAVYGNKVSRFGTMGNTVITLFSLCLGDEVYNTYMDLLEVKEVSSVITVFYLTTFVGIHFYVLSMSILAVVEEGFITQGLWLLDVDNNDHTMDLHYTSHNNSATIGYSSSPYYRSDLSATPGQRGCFQPSPARSYSTRSYASTPVRRSYTSSTPTGGRMASGVSLHVSTQAAQALQNLTWDRGTPPQRAQSATPTQVNKYL
mmetsp:Transcript_3881/g.5634  ORF Transcript_3881/g.5634 Transcript_3881/m.5634 type:complete len:619 (-) Transcript_3881:756-2612(-)